MSLNRLIKFRHGLWFLLFGILCTWGQISAQQIGTCGTTDAEQTSTDFTVQQKHLWNSIPRLSDVVMIPLQFHLIGANNGAFAMDSVLLFDELARVNDIYIDAQIEFVHCGRLNYINDNNYLTFIKNVDEDLCDIHDVEGVINIYFAPHVEREDGDGLCGYAYNYDIKRRVIMDNGCANNGSTLAHELGHSFSLLHTHSTSRGVEYVDGTNCSTAGDLLCDTPADPELSSSTVSTSCLYTGNETDPNGLTYQPDTRNLMSYSRKNCRIEFSPEQLDQIVGYHFMHSELLYCPSDSLSATQNLFDHEQHRVFPNPTTTDVYLSAIKAGSRTQILSMQGQLLWSKEWATDQDNGRIPLSGLPPATYILKVSKDKSDINYRLIKF